MFVRVFCLAFLCFGCSTAHKTPRKSNPLHTILSDAQLQRVLAKKEIYEVQIILTQIDRDEAQVPYFTTWHYQVDSNRYFYPASTVKMPLAALALEKIRHLNASGYPRLRSDTPYALEALRPYQKAYDKDTLAPAGKPTIAQDVRAIFAISDNDAYNHLFDFLGRGYINQQLNAKGYQHTRIQHRFYSAQRDQSLAQPIRFTDKSGRTIFQEPEKVDTARYVAKEKGLLKGRGYLNAQDSLVMAPFDFSSKNHFALSDMERMLRALLFPKAMPEACRFDISPNDYLLLHKAMGQFPRECTHPKYDPVTYWDSYVKCYVMGDTKAQQDGSLRLFNKIGQAYGTLTDVAYIIDPGTGTEFILAATILCNSDGIFNDDQYEFDQIGFPFLAQLGRSALAYEQKRPKKVRPNLDYWQNVVK